jgi:hypothetical protein
MVSKQPRARNFTLRLGALELESLDALARVQGGTPSDAIRFAIRFAAAAIAKDAQESTEVENEVAKD